ncbi:unnamed protein product [Adineta steineri]|uniref:Sulfatase N-terminal domain-containing protein n=1 Tax=Adineta steineri TaxID=433720 RepID=A0A819LUH6_9BILA|nr:unnamed protein product [Adineta steineri]
MCNGDNLSNYRSTVDLPSESDIAIIGSGYAASSCAYYLYKNADLTKNPLKITMIEARETCSRGYVPDIGIFDPPDSNILPLLWKWLDETLAEEQTHQLMMSLLVTGTHVPFLFPDDQSYTDCQYYTNDPYINAYLNTLRTTDEFFGKIIRGFKSRKLYDETLFITVSDYADVFNDHDSQTVGLLSSSPLESAFSVPLLLHNQYLQAKQLHVHLYHLEHDPFESIDLSNLDNQPANTHPLWIDIEYHK